MGNTAVVILNYNGVDYLKQFLAKVIEYSKGCKIVVIDNHSSDGSVAYVSATFPEVQLIKLPENYGFSGGYNRGLQQVEASNYVLLNSDVEVTENWIDHLQQYMDQHIEVAACQPKILSLKQRDTFDYAGAAGGFLDILGYPFCRGRIFDSLEQDRHQYQDNRKIFWAGGACFFIRAEVYHQLGGLDEDFFAHMEEIDLCWRIHRAGYQVAYVGASKIYHLGGGTLKETNPRKTFLNFRNGLQLLVKNSAIHQLIWKIPLRILLDMVAAFRFLFLGLFAHFWAVVRANSTFLWTFAQTWSKRSVVNLPYGGSLFSRLIVWEYYVKGKKTFAQLTKTSP